jgi:hypothetical protein
MTKHSTTFEQKLLLGPIASAMLRSGIDYALVYKAYRLAEQDQGVFDLMGLWMSAINNPAERSEILSDIQNSIDDYYF